MSRLRPSSDPNADTASCVVLQLLTLSVGVIYAICGLENGFHDTNIAGQRITVHGTSRY